MAKQAIEFHGVTKSYRRGLFGEWVAALSGVSFDVSPGEVCAFLGPNGAGKTTSINLLMGFLPLDQGEISVLDSAPGDIRAKKQIGFLPENFAFYKYMTAEKLLRFHLRLSERKVEDAGPLIADLIHKVRLDGFENLRIGRYSRGMVQRIGLAQTLLGNPQLLVLDEPTSGLDPAGRKEVRDLIVALKAEGKTVFLSSHLLSEVEQICDRVIIINRGHMVRAGRLEEMLALGDRVELVVDNLPEHVKSQIGNEQVTVETTAHGIRITAAAARKRKLAEMLWAAGCDVISMTPLRNTLEDLFLESVGEGGKKAS